MTEPIPTAANSALNQNHATHAKRGKTCNPCLARENMQPVQSAGKREQNKSRLVLALIGWKTILHNCLNHTKPK